MKELLKICLLVSALALASQAVCFQECKQAAMPDLALAGFKHNTSSLMSWLTYYHGVSDPMTIAGKKAHIEGKFAYGLVFKHLKDEKVEIWLDDCSQSMRLLETIVTSDEGKISQDLAGTDGLIPGRYRLLVRVVGDNTAVIASLHVYPKAMPVVVFDIDGTLTAGDCELWKELAVGLWSGTYEPEIRVGAVAATALWADQGRAVIYLTARHYSLADRTRRWLDQSRFAKGPLLVVSSAKELLPNINSAGAYKLGRLNQIREKGFSIKAGYGNTYFDIWAYQNAGLPSSRIFILGETIEKANAVMIGQSFVDHLAQIGRQVDYQLALN